MSLLLLRHFDSTYEQTVFSQRMAKLILSKLTSYWRRYHTHYATRRQLASLSDEQLDDVGISREQALLESRKPFWK